MISGVHVFPGSRRFVIRRLAVRLVDHCAAQEGFWDLGEKVEWSTDMSAVSHSGADGDPPLNAQDESPGKAKCHHRCLRSPHKYKKVENK